MLYIAAAYIQMHFYNALTRDANTRSPNQAAPKGAV